MASNLRVDNIQPSTGMGIGIGTANGSIYFNSDINGGMNIATGSVGIGTTPEAFHSNNKGVIRGDGGYFILGRNTNDSLYIAQNYYYDSSDVGRYIVNGEASVYAQDNGEHIFYGAASGTAGDIASHQERARFTSNGLRFPAGLGIDFSLASGSSAGSTSALLDDYEEGTWTPVASRYTTGAITATYTVQEGFYIKIGNSVTLWGRIIIDTVTSQGTNVTYVGGIPFPAKRSYTGIGLVYFNNAIATSAVNKVAATTDSRLYMLIDQNGNSNGVYDWQAGDFYFCVTYEVS